jgi:hypothetical protein
MTPTPRMGRRAGRGMPLLSILPLLLATGCMNQQLRFSARRTANTLPDLQYHQVMDNLAMIAANPGFLPYLAVAGQGSVQVTDGGNSSLSLTMVPKMFTSGLFGLGASRNVTGTWSLGTITSPEKIRGMQTAYQRAARGSVEGDPAYAWLKVGCKKDVPKNASYVAQHGEVFAWVMPDGMTGLSDLTLTIMDIATREAAVPTPRPPATAREASPGSTAPEDVPRRNFQVPPSGPVFTPGVR